MGYEVTLASVDSQRIAANRDRVPLEEIPARYGPSLDEVWQFVRDGGIGTDHNVFLYNDGPPPLVQIGVQVREDFADGKRVVCAETPGGAVATTTHVGPYDQLPSAHAAVRAWCQQQGHAISGKSWEVYGEWTDDPALLETEVYYLLRT
jgi:effector-binding domain-containing protein